MKITMNKAVEIVKGMIYEGRTIAKDIFIQSIEDATGEREIQSPGISINVIHQDER